MMSERYKAFISYRHHPEDIAVATQIHRLLERYHVPSELKKQGREIGRIFRDKDELPTSSNLSENIYQALDHSEYLVVVCSTRTKDSIWIEREIEHFLTTHTRDRVLTVLVDGEPGDVIPEKLLFERIKDQDGKERTVALEPLSCDWRVGKKEAVGRELPRLAAALLGCSYDELVRRQQKYRTRKFVSVAAAAFAVVLAVACYYIYSANQISKSLEKSLYNQAQYLASESIQSFDDGDRLKAVALALEAIGAGETERPYNPSAELALSQAVMPYGGGGDNFVSVAAFSAGEYTQIEKFALSDDEKYLYTVDAKNKLTIFDTEARKKLVAVVVDGDIDSLAGLADHTVLVDAEATLFCYDTDGKELWKKENISSYALCEGGEKLIAEWQDESFADYVGVLDSKTGTILNEVKIPDGIDDLFVAGKEYVNADFIALRASDFFEKTEDMYICNINSGDFQHLYQSDNGFCTSTVTQDGKLVVLEYNRSNYEMTGRFLDMTTTSKLLYHVKCYDILSGKLLWKNDFVTYRYKNHALEVTPDQSKVVCQAGNSICVMDLMSGEKIYENEAESAIIDLYAENERVLCLTENGKTLSANYAETYLSSLPVCGGADWLQAQRNHNIFALSRLSFSVIEYSNPDIKPQWEAPTEFDDEITIENGKIYAKNNDAYVVFDINTKDTKTVNNNPDVSSDFIGLSSDGVLWNIGDKKIADESASERPFLFGCDFNTGSITEYEVKRPEDDQDSPFSLRSNECCITEDRLLYIYKSSNYPDYELRLVKSDLNGENLTYHTVLQYDSNKSIYPEIIGCTDKYVYLYMEKEYYKFENGKVVKERDDEYILLEVEISTGESREFYITSQEQNKIFAADGQSGRFAYIYDGVVKVGIAGEDKSFDLTTQDGVNLSKPVFNDDEIFALGDDKYLYRFSTKDGSLLNKTLLNNIYSSYEVNLFAADSDFTVERTSDGYLIANVFGMANIVETVQWTAVASVPSFIAYDEASDSFICQENRQYISYKHLSREELIEKGKELVKDYQLTEKEKEEYGIG